MVKYTDASAREAMRRVPLFSALADTELQGFRSMCRTRKAPEGTLLFTAGDVAESFYVILAGKVKVFQLSARGDEQILHLYGPGQTFGEAAMWAGSPYPANAEVVSEAVLLVVGRQVLERAVRDNPKLALDMFAGLSAKLREFNQLIEQLSLREVPARLATVLLEMSAQAGSNRIKLTQTKRELAAQIGTIAETLSRAFAKLKRAGLIDVRGAEITILDPDGLEDQAGG